MKEIIKNIKRKIVGLINHFAWNKQYKRLISDSKKNNYIIDSDWYKGVKILMMVPHADDEIISSYTVLCGATDVTLYYCGFTGSNNSEDNRIIRRNELLMLCSKLKVNVIDGNRGCENLEEVLDNSNYDAILLPSLADWHEEHRKISYILNDICSNQDIAPVIFCYSVTVPNESEKEVMCVPLSKELQAMKYDMFRRVYHSQSFMPVERLRLNERINGFHAGCYAAETFCKYDYEHWSKMVSKVKKMERDGDSKFYDLVHCMKESLNNIILIRHISKDFYDLLVEE